jgi:hypothetical protein
MFWRIEAREETERQDPDSPQRALRRHRDHREIQEAPRLRSKEDEKERFFALAYRLAKSRDLAEHQRIKRELSRMTFGE